jgi:RND family efflux transporter MFP subunit
MLNHQAQPGEAQAMPDSPPEPVAARVRSLQVAERERRGGRGPVRGRRRLWLAVPAVLAAVVWATWFHLAGSSLPEVETYTFTGKAPRHILLDLTGCIVPRTRIVISPQVGGIIARDHLPLEGQKVKGGALLFEIEDTRYREDYLQAEAGLAAARAQLLELENGTCPEEIDQAAATVEQAREQVALMKEEWERTRKLFTSRAISLSEVDKAHTLHVSAQKRLRVEQAKYDQARRGPRREKIDAARAEVRRAQATCDRARYSYGQTKIYAPGTEPGKSFTLLERKVSPGESIQADLTYTALCTLADLSRMEAEIDVQERDLSVLKIGGPCEVIPDAYPDRSYRGHINRKQPLVNRQRGVVQVKITIDRPDEYVLPNMNARVLLLEEEPGKRARRDLPEIPRRALVVGSDSPTVVLLTGQRAHLQRIEIGATHGDWVQVRQGLQAEDQVILPGDPPVREGQPVRARATGGSGESDREESHERKDR